MSMNELDTRANIYFELLDQIAELEAQAEAIKDEMKAVMVDRAEEEINGHGWRATWHNTATSRFDSKAFKAAHKDLYDAFTIKATSTRFTLNRLKA